MVFGDLILPKKSEATQQRFAQRVNALTRLGWLTKPERPTTSRWEVEHHPELCPEMEVSVTRHDGLTPSHHLF